ncbi:MAG: hypothetical protein GXZ15_03690 [Campylobacter sp.]|nr:hypothetical protein [Campylobacter sp.]
MKKISILSLVCLSVMFAQSSNEIYTKALEYEARGDFKSAMLEYKKLAQQQVTSQPEELQEANNISSINSAGYKHKEDLDTKVTFSSDDRRTFDSSKATKTT